MQFEYGFVFALKRFAIAVQERAVTAEYKNAPAMQYGSFTFFIGL
jgi:hypothetical protein